MTWHQISLAIWIALATLLIVCQVVVLRSHGRLPRIGELFSRITSTGAGRGLLLLGWMWLGWHAFAR